MVVVWEEYCSCGTGDGRIGGCVQQYRLVKKAFL